MTEDTMEKTLDSSAGTGVENEGTNAEERAVDDAIGAELRQVGDRLAAAIRAAVGTDEAEALRGEVRAGIRRLKEEFEEALEKAPRPLRRKSASDDDDAEATDADTGSRRNTLRKDIAHALRSWAERAASTIEPTADDAAGSPTSSASANEPWGDK